MTTTIILKWVAVGAVAVLILTGLWAGVKAMGRYQTLADEQNQVQVNDIQIAQTEQLVLVQKQKAQIKIEEAKGIAEAQRIINNTLTPLYLQHEAIQAMENNPGKTVYIPSGNGGIPFVQPLVP